MFPHWGTDMLSPIQYCKCSAHDEANMNNMRIASQVMYLTGFWNISSFNHDGSIVIFI
jgi:hypothetical protein